MANGQNEPCRKGGERSQSKSLISQESASGFCLYQNYIFLALKSSVPQSGVRPTGGQKPTFPGIGLRKLRKHFSFSRGHLHPEADSGRCDGRGCSCRGNAPTPPARDCG